MIMRKVIAILVVALVAVLTFYSTAGWREQVPDFVQPTTYTGGTEPVPSVTTPVSPPTDEFPIITPPTPPVVWTQVSIEYVINNIGIAGGASGSDFTPQLDIDNLTVHQSAFLGLETAQIFKTHRLQLLSFWTPPHLPSARSWSIEIVVLSATNVVGWWNDTVVYTTTGDVFTINGESGRVFIKDPGVYSIEFKCVDTLNLAVYGVKVQSFTIESYFV
jgi:hypothetical protein